MMNHPDPPSNTQHSTPLLILGASTRAAAFSARRAGFSPYCVDLFADRDLRNRFHVRRVRGAEYPDCLASVHHEYPQCPWIFTGALENYPELLRTIAAARPLLGGPVDSIEAVRHPESLVQVVRSASLPYAELDCFSDEESSTALVKPRRGAAGLGIRIASRRHSSLEFTSPDYYTQRMLTGTSCSVIFLGSTSDAVLVGTSRQVVGHEICRARPFQYCGNVAPFKELEVEHVRLLGRTLAQAFGLKGLFCVDGIWTDGEFVPVEVNPRYSASVEVIELAEQRSLLALHSEACDHPSPVNCHKVDRLATHRIVGKVVLYAPCEIIIPAIDPFESAPFSTREFVDDQSCWQLPQYADIPDAGTVIRHGHPILTVFARAESHQDCLFQLEKLAADLYRTLGM